MIRDWFGRWKIFHHLVPQILKVWLFWELLSMVMKTTKAKQRDKLRWTPLLIANPLVRANQIGNYLGMLITLIETTTLPEREEVPAWVADKNHSQTFSMITNRRKISLWSDVNPHERISRVNLRISQCMKTKWNVSLTFKIANNVTFSLVKPNWKILLPMLRSWPKINPCLGRSCMKEPSKSSRTTIIWRGRTDR